MNICWISVEYQTGWKCAVCGLYVSWFSTKRILNEFPDGGRCSVCIIRVKFKNIFFANIRWISVEYLLNIRRAKMRGLRPVGQVVLNQTYTKRVSWWRRCPECVIRVKLKNIFFREYPLNICWISVEYQTGWKCAVCGLYVSWFSTKHILNEFHMADVVLCVLSE